MILSLVNDLRATIWNGRDISRPYWYLTQLPDVCLSRIYTANPHDHSADMPTHYVPSPRVALGRN